MTLAVSSAMFAAFAGAIGLAELLGMAIPRVARAQRRGGDGLLVRIGRIGSDLPLAHTAERLLDRVATSWLGSLSPPARLEAKLEAAGDPGGLGQREWFVLKAGCGASAALGASILGARGSSAGTLLLVLGGAACGFFAPDFFLARRARRRVDDALRDLPDMLDLMRVTVEAGMAPARALGNVAAQFRGPLAGEWRRVAAEVALGAPQDEALAPLAKRLPCDEVAAFVQSLTRSRRHGVPLGRALAAQAARARHQRAQRVRERAARAGPMIQLVVALLLVPSVLLMVAAAVLAELERSGLGLPGY